jgi:hypothetical protein
MPKGFVIPSVLSEFTEIAALVVNARNIRIEIIKALLMRFLFDYGFAFFRRKNNCFVSILKGKT